MGILAEAEERKRFYNEMQEADNARKIALLRAQAAKETPSA